MSQLEDNRTLMEEVINEYAQKLAKKRGLKPDCFRIHIEIGGKHETIFKGGTVVHIYTSILPIHPDANSHIRNWLRVIPRLLQRSELVHVKDIYEWKNDRKKLLAIKGLDTDLIPTLLDSTRLQVTVMTKVIVKDRITGIVAECESERESSKSMIETCRAKISAQVHAMELEEISESPEIEIVEND